MLWGIIKVGCWLTGSSIFLRGLSHWNWMICLSPTHAPIHRQCVAFWVPVTIHLTRYLTFVHDRIIENKPQPGQKAMYGIKDHELHNQTTGVTISPCHQFDAWNEQTRAEAWWSFHRFVHELAFPGVTMFALNRSQDRSRRGMLTSPVSGRIVWLMTADWKEHLVVSAGRLSCIGILTFFIKGRVKCSATQALQ